MHDRQIQKAALTENQKNSDQGVSYCEIKCVSYKMRQRITKKSCDREQIHGKNKQKQNDAVYRVLK